MAEVAQQEKASDVLGRYYQALLGQLLPEDLVYAIVVDAAQKLHTELLVHTADGTVA